MIVDVELPTPSPNALVLGSSPSGKFPRHVSDYSGKIFRQCAQDVRVGGELAYYSVVPDVDYKVNKEGMMKCRDNVLSTVDALGVQTVILYGATAFGMWRSDISITDWDGFAGRLMDRWWVVGISAQGMRAGGVVGKETRERIRNNILRVVNQTCKEPDHCVKCGKGYTWRKLVHDRDGVTYCTRHFTENKWTWKKQRDRWVEKPEQLRLPV